MTGGLCAGSIRDMYYMEGILLWVVSKLELSPRRLKFELLKFQHHPFCSKGTYNVLTGTHLEMLGECSNQKDLFSNRRPGLEIKWMKLLEVSYLATSNKHTTTSSMLWYWRFEKQLKC